MDKVSDRRGGGGGGDGAYLTSVYCTETIVVRSRHA